MTNWMFATVALAVTALPTAALAIPIDWTIQAPVGTAQSNSIIEGKFTFDADTNVVSNVKVQRFWEGQRPAQTTYTAGHIGPDPFVSDITSIVFFDPSGGDESGRPAALITFQTFLTNSGGSRKIIRVSEGGCLNPTCADVSGLITFKDGSANGVPQAGGPPPTPAPIPTLSEWAMILLGVALAGGASLMLQRRTLSR